MDPVRLVDLSWDNKFSQADATAAPLVSAHPRYSLCFAESLSSPCRVIPLDMALKLWLNGAEEHRRDALARFESCEDMAQSFRKSKSKLAAIGGETAKIECKVILADAILFRSLLQLSGNDKVKGAYYMRKSWKIYEKLYKKLGTKLNVSPDSEIALGIKFGVGLFYFIVSTVSTLSISSSLRSCPRAF